jgi:hypothetical protein
MKKQETVCLGGGISGKVLLIQKKVRKGSPLFFFFFFAVLGIEPRASDMLG